jgi:uncharacterized membrane protein SpoIIM required for sporulation
MNSEKFIELNRKTWEKLNTILDFIAKKGAASLGEEDIKDLGPLFKQVTAHLAYVKTNYPKHELNDYLNGLVAKAHSHIYKSETFGLRKLSYFYTYDFPELIRKYWGYVTTAMVVLLLGLVLGFVIHFIRPSLDGLIIPDTIQRSISQGLEEGKVGSEWSFKERPVISTQIMINNIMVGVLAFGLGFTWGVGTITVLFINGILVGVLGAIFAEKTHSYEFWALILPHGVLELSAIFICGGAGLVLAKALVKPEDYTRKDALVLQGRIAIKMLFGTIPMFIIAALIEGFFTPLNIANWYKYIFALVSAIGIAWYFMILGRAYPRREKK